MSVCRYVVHPSIRSSVHRKFVVFQWNFLCTYRSMTDARRYAVWPDPRSRSRSWGFWSYKNCTFQSLSPPPFTMGAGTWPLILKLELNIWIFGAGFLILVLVFVSRDLEFVGVPAISPSTKKFFFNFNEIWYVDKGRWLMHDGMPYDPIQGQGQGHK